MGPKLIPRSVFIAGGFDLGIRTSAVGLVLLILQSRLQAIRCAKDTEENILNAGGAALQNLAGSGVYARIGWRSYAAVTTSRPDSIRSWLETLNQHVKQSYGIDAVWSVGYSVVSDPANLTSEDLRNLEWRTSKFMAQNPKSQVFQFIPEEQPDRE